MAATGKTILVVDDEAIIREAIRRVLERTTSFHVLTADDGEPALETFKQEHVDLVVTDLLMARMGGIELLRQLRQLAPDLPVIIVTGYGTLEDAIEALHLGVSDFVKKPFDIRELIHTIDAVLERQDAGGGASLPPPPTRTPQA
jgi:DNA-binding NtrC family response regulator